MLDALGPFHCCQRIGVSLQVQELRKGRRLLASLLFMWIKIVSGNSHIAVIVCNGMSWSSCQDETSPCLCLPVFPQPWLKMEPLWFWCQWPHMTSNLMLRLFLGVFLGRLLPGCFLGASVCRNYSMEVMQSWVCGNIPGEHFSRELRGVGMFFNCQTWHHFLRGWVSAFK